LQLPIKKKIINFRERTGNHTPGQSSHTLKIDEYFNNFTYKMDLLNRLVDTAIIYGYGWLLYKSKPADESFASFVEKYIAYHHHDSKLTSKLKVNLSHVYIQDFIFFKFGERSQPCVSYKNKLHFIGFGNTWFPLQ